MKKLILLSALVVFISLAKAADAYRIDDQSIDQLFAQALDLSVTSTALLPTLSNPKIASDMFAEDDNKEVLAGAVAIASVLFGVGLLIPVHRFILGTGGHNFKIFALYCVTLDCGGFLTLVDGIILLTDDSKKKYINNPKWFMWASN